MDVKDKELANLETKFQNALEGETSVAFYKRMK